MIEIGARRAADRACAPVGFHLGSSSATAAATRAPSLNHEGWRALRMLAAERDTKLNALAIEAFNDLLAKFGKRRSVENPLLGK